MLFHTLDYLLFLPLCVALYWSVPRRWRLWVLFGSSVLFYASWSVLYLLVLVGVALVAWAGSAHLSTLSPKRAELPRRAGLLVVVLAPLIFFKYWDWIAGNIETVAVWVEAVVQGRAPWAMPLPEVSGIDPSLAADRDLPLVLPRVALPLPVGISFFTFQALAYVIDAARDRKAEHDPLTFATFLAFFPQLVAGPIVRRHELLPQLRSLPLLQPDNVGSGIFRILRGMAKKVLVADVVRVGMVDPVFQDPGRFTGPELAIALYAYTLQIYYDFSAYTDIAIGSARLFGIELPENFRRPYQATCVAGFWRRWHITLSNWVRDYIYYPLGGSQVEGGEWKVYRNILATLVIIGIWHGASWNFVIYGILHGTAVGICRYRRKTTGRRPGDPLPNLWAFTWRWVGTFHFIVLARVLFRSDGLGGAWDILSGLARLELVLPRYSPMVWTVFIVGYLVHFTPIAWSKQAEGWFKVQRPAMWAGVAAAVAMACTWLGTGDSLAFVYYQF